VESVLIGGTLWVMAAAATVRFVGYWGRRGEAGAPRQTPCPRPGVTVISRRVDASQEAQARPVYRQRAGHRAS